MFKLQRLKIHQCRSVVSGTELEFNGDFNVLLGKNGAGKTTLLKLVAAACSSCFADEFLSDEIHVEYEYTLGEVRVVCVVRQGDAGDETLPGEATPRMRMFLFDVEFSAPNSAPIIARIRGNRLEVSADGKLVHSLLVSPMISVVPSLDLVTFIALSLPPGDLSLEVRGGLGTRSRLTYRLDEGIDWLRATLNTFGIIFTATDEEELWCLPNVRHSGAADEFRAAFAAYRGRFDDLPDVMTLHSSDLPVLERICRQIGVKDCSWTMSFREQGRRSPETKRYGDSQVYITTDGGSRFPLEKLSFGQLRLFGFFLHSLMHPHVIVADELTNGLHHEMINCCFETIGARQAFLATQNPLLLDHIGFDSAEEVRRTFILCDLQGEEGTEKKMLWRNMSAEEAREFFGDYEVGIEHANDILRKRGLW